MSFFSEYFGISEDTGEHPVCCPFPHHTSSGAEYFESHPSAHVNTEKGVFHCKVCDTGYSEAQFIQKILGCKFADAKKIEIICKTAQDKGEWTKSTSLKPDSKEKALHFGISETTINELQLATPDLEMDTIAFPVFMFGMIMDIRTYNPGHKPKVRSLQKAPSGLIIPFDIWNNECEKTPNRWTVLCAGEKDMAVARSNGLNAITLTGGEGTSPKQLNFFKDRPIAIVYDNDGAGINGAKKLARELYQVTNKIKIVTGFHEICKEEHEDITDFFTKYNKTKEDLVEYMKNTPLYNPEEDPDYRDNYPIVTLLEATQPKYLNRLVRSNIQVIATYEDVFSCPSSVIAEKTMAGGNDLMQVGDTKTWELNEDNLGDILHLIDNNFKEVQIKEHLRDLLHIMQKEKYVSIKELETITIFKAYITDLYETKNADDVQPQEILAYSINKKLESGQKYLITYKLVQHPYKGNQLIMIANDFKQANDSISNFRLDAMAIENLKVIQNLTGSIEERINCLVQKAKGVIGYDGNNTLITAIDLAFNTALQFNFGSFKSLRAYLDTLIISESRIGKSSTVDAFRQLYGLGTKVSLAGNSATIAGIVGGSNKLSAGYQTRAGVIPQNNKGLIIFEEFGKSSNEISKELTDIRSSNEVRITRVSGNLTLPALVRMITLTNQKTVNGQIKSIASYPNGFEILTELVDTAEDIARYDMVVILSDRGTKEIDPLWRPEEPLPEEVYKTRIRWIWSRTSDQIILSEDIERYIIEKSNELNKTYDCHIKIFGTEAWKKISRLAIAIAGYLVSTDESFNNIVIKREHIDYAVQFLTNLYDNSTFKLKEYVREEKRYTTIDKNGVALLQEIYDKNPMLILQLEQSASITKNVLQAATGLNNDEVNRALNALTKGLFVKYANYDIIPTERFRIGLTEINRETSLRKLGESYA